MYRKSYIFTNGKKAKIYNNEAIAIERRKFLLFILLFNTKKIINIWSMIQEYGLNKKGKYIEVFLTNDSIKKNSFVGL